MKEKRSLVEILVGAFFAANRDNKISCIKFIRDISHTKEGAAFFGVPAYQNNIGLLHAKTFVEEYIKSKNVFNAVWDDTCKLEVDIKFCFKSRLLHEIPEALPECEALDMLK